MAGAKKNFKATKKFEQKHLKGVLENRKATAKIKQRQQVKAKKQSKRSKDAEFYKGAEAEGAPGKPNGGKKTANVNSMSVDDFFGGGFEIIEKSQPGKKASKKLGKRKIATMMAVATLRCSRTTSTSPMRKTCLLGVIATALLTTKTAAMSE